MPRAASASMFGVFVCGCPPIAPTQLLRSSIAMKRTSGRSWASTEAQVISIRQTATLLFSMLVELPPGDVLRGSYRLGLQSACRPGGPYGAFRTPNEKRRPEVGILSGPYSN
jgi:hypothetical protein